MTDEEWAFVAPYFTLMKKDAMQQKHDFREIFNDVRYAVRAECPWRSLPNDLAAWEAVYQQAGAGLQQRFLKQSFTICELPSVGKWQERATAYSNF